MTHSPSFPVRFLDGVTHSPSFSVQSRKKVYQSRKKVYQSRKKVCQSGKSNRKFVLGTVRKVLRSFLILCLLTLWLISVKWQYALLTTLSLQLSAKKGGYPSSPGALRDDDHFGGLTVWGPAAIGYADTGVYEEGYEQVGSVSRNASRSEPSSRLMGGD